jgi:hypothetical protein
MVFHTKEDNLLRVFENKVLRRIFGPKGEEVAGGWRRLHNEDLHNLYDLRNIVTMIKSRKMRWMGHVEHREYMRTAYSNVENMKRRVYSEDLVVDGRNVLG